jgi:hypothetical protein
MENNNTELDLLKDINIKNIYFNVVEEIKYVAIKSIGYSTRNQNHIQNLKHLNSIQNSNHSELAGAMKNNYFGYTNSNLYGFDHYTSSFTSENTFANIYPLADGMSVSGTKLSGSKKGVAETSVGRYVLPLDIINTIPEKCTPETVNVYCIITIEFTIKGYTHINKYKYQYIEEKFELHQGTYDILKESSVVEDLILETIFNIDI